MESSGDSLFAGKRSKLYECGKTVAAFTVFFIAGISVAIAVVALKKANDSQTQISDLQETLQRLGPFPPNQLLELCPAVENCRSYKDLNDLANLNAEQIGLIQGQILLIQSHATFLQETVDSIPNDREAIMTLQDQTAILNQNLFRFTQYPFPYNGKIYFLTAYDASWDGVRQQCLSYGADLAVDGIKDYTTRLSIATALNLDITWVGITDGRQEGNWTWVDGTAGNASEIVWARDQPDNFDFDEHCGEMWPRYNDFKMNDENCEHRHKGLCEKELGRLEPMRPTESDGPNPE